MVAAPVGKLVLCALLGAVTASVFALAVSGGLNALELVVSVTIPSWNLFSDGL